MADEKVPVPSGNDTDDNTLNETSAGATSPGLVFRTKETDPESAANHAHGTGSTDGEPENDDDDVTKDGDAADPHALAQVTSFSFTDVPDGGLQAWLCVLGIWCTSFCSFGWINSVGIFQDYYQTGPLSSYSSSTIAWIPSLQIFFMMFMGPLIGRLFDKYGPRKIILVGSLVDVFGLMMASISSEYYQFLLSQGVCSAIGVSAIFQPALGCIPGWFSKRRGVVYGIVSTGSSLGGVIFPVMVNRLIRSIGYGWAMRACAFMILGLLIIANLTVHSRFHAHPHFKPGPRMHMTSMFAPAKEPGFALLLAGMFFLTFGVFVPITYIPVSALATGRLSADLSQYTLSILNALSLFGRLLSGWLSDSVGKFNTFLCSCLMAGIFILGLWIPAESKAEVIAFAAVFGFFSGAYVSLIGSLVAQVSPHKEIGYRTGLVFLVNSIPGLTTGPIAGAILAHKTSSGHENWVGVKVFAGVMLIAGSALVLMSRIKYAGAGLKTVF